MPVLLYRHPLQKAHGFFKGGLAISGPTLFAAPGKSHGSYFLPQVT
jgi:hypothetical protein